MRRLLFVVIIAITTIGVGWYFIFCSNDENEADSLIRSFLIGLESDMSNKIGEVQDLDDPEIFGRIAKKYVDDVEMKPGVLSCEEIYINPKFIYTWQVDTPAIAAVYGSSVSAKYKCLSEEFKKRLYIIDASGNVEYKDKVFFESFVSIKQLLGG